MAFSDQVSNFLFGAPAKTEQLARFLPQQQQGLLQALNLGLGGLQSNQFNFDPIAQVARTQFSTQTLPGILEQFTGAGGSRSSALQGALGSAGAGLEQQLAAMRSNYALQQQGLLQDLLKIGLTQPFENIYIPQGQGFLSAAAPGIGYGATQLLGNYLFGGQQNNDQNNQNSGSMFGGNTASTNTSSGMNRRPASGQRGFGSFGNFARSASQYAPEALSVFGPYGALAGAGVKLAGQFF